MSVLTLGSADLRFAEGELVWRPYTAAEAYPRPGGWKESRLSRPGPNPSQ